MKTAAALILTLVCLSACTSPADPCPLPVEAHPDVWTAKPLTDASGQIVAWTYICTGSGVVAR